MAKATSTVPSTPKALAEMLKVDAKRIRAFLRSEFPRKAEAKNTSWTLSPAESKAVIERFTPKASPAKES